VPDHWRSGIGTWLVQEAEHMLFSRGYCDIVLWVFEDNTDARRFYEAMGFRVDGAFKTLELGAPLKAIRYKKRVAVLA
jgi:ribosomal protein S18 acetylase RimI-like enzyme